MYGVLDFYKACKEQGITPIIGTEAYMAANSRFDRPVRRGRLDDTGGEGERGEKLYYHLTMLAETSEGYANLMKLSSAAYLEGYYYKPRLDWELLERLPRRADRDDRLPRRGRLAGAAAGQLRGGDETRRQAAGHLRPRQPVRRAARPRTRRTAPDEPAADRDRETIGAPLVATNDSHYCRREDSVSHDALLCVQTGATIDDPKRFKFDGRSTT
jgi:DNA polymerase-3 subunit alpha